VSAVEGRAAIGDDRQFGVDASGLVGMTVVSGGGACSL